MGNIGGFTRTPDRTEVIIGSIDSDNTLCQVNPSTGQNSYVQASGATSTKNITISSDQKYVILPGYSNQVIIYNAQTLNQITAFNASGDVSTATNFALSSDSSTLFVPSAEFVYAYSLTTFQQVG